MTEGCTLSNGHEGECVLPEEGGEPDAPAACTKTEGCTLAEGPRGRVCAAGGGRRARCTCGVHKDRGGCTLAEGHEGACVLPEEGGEPDAPAACTKTEGCTLAEGHEGACAGCRRKAAESDAPAVCTKTEGCTLAEGP